MSMEQKNCIKMSSVLSSSEKCITDTAPDTTTQPEEGEQFYNIILNSLKDSSMFTRDNQASRQHLERCKRLYARDYEFVAIDNSNSRLCSTYPLELIIPTRQKGSEDDVSFEESDYIQLLSDGRHARTRARFPVPVFSVFGKHICRSSTLARSGEIYPRYMFSSNINPTATSSGNGVQYCATDESDSNIALPRATPNAAVNGNNEATGSNNKVWMIDKMRKADIDLLKYLKVGVICDLMVENKKLKYGMHVTSSEKVDSARRYDHFQLLAVPYPGCEFFADYARNQYNGHGLHFDWSQEFCDANLRIPVSIRQRHVDRDLKWDEYTGWDLITLTQNYLKLILTCIRDPDHKHGGFLIHCISGWDRTPLFVSILRLSLWADDLIHQSLNAKEILYLTLVYDWLLFHHQFANRVQKSEEILHFCFEFLRHIADDDYSLCDVIDDGDDESDEPSRTPMRCESTSDSEQMFQLDSFSESLNGATTAGNQYGGHDHESESESGPDSQLDIPVDFTSQRRKQQKQQRCSNGGSPSQHKGMTRSSCYPLMSSSPLSSSSHYPTTTTLNHSNFDQTNSSVSRSMITINDVTTTGGRVMSVSSDPMPVPATNLLNSSSSGRSLSADYLPPPPSHHANNDVTDTTSSTEAAVAITPSAARDIIGKRTAASSRRNYGGGSSSTASWSEAGSLCGVGGGVKIGSAVEPGSSWQMISSSPPQLNNNTSHPPHLLPHRPNDSMTSFSSEPSLLLLGNSSQHMVAPQPVAGKSLSFRKRSRLDRRKERLSQVAQLFLPAYRAAVRDYRAPVQSHGLLSYISTFVNRS